MFELILGSFVLSLTHALIPNHWFPLVAISRTEKWTREEAMKVTAITGFAHTASTILIGLFVGFIGYKLSSTLELFTNIIAPALLILLGLIYIILNFTIKHEHKHINEEAAKGKSKFAIIATLGTAMFFSPCIEIEAYYLNAGAYGWTGILILSIIYLTVTVVFLVALVDLGRKSLDKLKDKLHLLEKYERLITGSVLIALGIFTYFFK